MIPVTTGREFKGCAGSTFRRSHMFKVIVVGTDGSDRAGMAVDRSVALAQMVHARLHVVHAVRPSVIGTEFVDQAGVVMSQQDMRERGDRICAEIVAKADGEGVAATAHSVDGDPADALVKVAEAVDADLVVLGNRGMSGVKRFVLGSVPNRVSHRCRCSVLIVNTDGI
jgi:nucleotide-binding universal stress UspA family protein